MRKYKVGDIVTVIDDGDVYAGHGEFFRKLNFYNKTKNIYNTEDDGKPWVVCGKVTQWDEEIYMIQSVSNAKKQILIGSYGLSKQSKKDRRIVELENQIKEIKNILK